MIIKRSKHSLKGDIIKIRRGLAIYQTHASPYYFARILDAKTRKYIVRSTKETSRITARETAEELALTLLSRVKVSVEHNFDHYADKMLKRSEIEITRGNKNIRYTKDASAIIYNADWGLQKFFRGLDVREIKTRDYQSYVDDVLKKRPDIAASTINSAAATLRNILKVARDDGVIDDIPSTPRRKSHDNPRPFFRFAPLTSKASDQYKLLLDKAKQLAKEKYAVRGIPITDELHDLILFVVHSFIRPTSTELYALKHADITVAQDPKRLILTIRNGKTGHRISNTMEAAVSVYERIVKRYPKHSTPTDYLFLPQYSNRGTASRIINRQFNEVLAQGNLKHDPFTKSDHTLYSLRHTAICMRLVLSGGKVNIYNLAKNAGTSVEQIERFYAKNLPLSAELARNLQSFEGDK